MPPIEDDPQPAAADDAAEAAESEAPEDGAADESAAIEAEARKQGWAPLDEFRGDREDWLPADEYVRMGDPKYLRKALKETRKAVSKLEQVIATKDAEFGERLERFERMSKAQRAKLYQDIEASRRQAVEEGDTKRYDELNRAEAALYEQEREAEKPAAPTAEKAPQAPHPDVDAWVKANPWFVKDKALNRLALGLDEQLMEEEPELTVPERLAKVRREVIKRFPEKFRKPGSGGAPANGHSAVEGGGRMPPAKAVKGWAEIPAEDKTIIKRHIEEGLYKDQAEAAKAYWS